MAIKLYEKLPANKRFGAIAIGINQRKSKSGKLFWYLDCMLYEDSKYFGIRSILVDYVGGELESDEEENKIIIETGYYKQNGYPKVTISEVNYQIDKPFGVIKTDIELEDLNAYHNGEKNRFTQNDTFRYKTNNSDYEKDSFYALTDGQFGSYDDFDGDLNDIMGSLGYD